MKFIISLELDDKDIEKLDIEKLFALQGALKKYCEAANK